VTSTAPASTKVIWDLAATAWVLQPDWLQTELTTSPILTSELTWSRDHRRHLIAEVTQVHRDQVFGDLFRRLDGEKRESPGPAPGDSVKSRHYPTKT
jgi:hypothetical protein